MEITTYRQYIIADDKNISQEEIDYVKNIPLKKLKDNDIVFTNYNSYENFNDDKCLAIINKYQEVFEEIRYRNNYKHHDLKKYWLQKYNKDDFHDIHTHGTQDNEYSFIIYVDCTENSSDTFFYPLGYPHISYRNFTPLRFKPKKGRILFFNSFLPHGVTPNKDESRLIISGNMIYE